MAYLGNSQFQGIISGGNIQDGSIESIDLATLTNIDINSGSIDGTIIGASSAAAGTFTSVDVTGTVTADGLTVSGVSNANVQLQSTGGNTYQVRTDINEMYMYQANRGAPIAKFAYNGDVSFYEDTGTTAKMVWDASAESLTILGDTGRSTEISDDAIKFERAGANYIMATSTSGSIEAWTGNSRSVVIDSSGNVGIGNSSPETYGGVAATTALVVGGTSGNNGVNVVSGSTSTGSYMFSDSGGNDRGGFTYYHTADLMTISTNGSERARIDSSGNLLVGKASVDYNTVGAEILPSGRVFGIASGLSPFYANRKGSDGALIDFGKDGAAVGSINSNSDGTISIRSGLSTGYLKLGGSGGDFYEVANTTFYPTSDNTSALGTTANRFKDLYLSGGVYLGGTGSTNKLDDYETGTFTPTLNAGTTTSATGKYVKVGDLVTISVEFTVGTGGGSQISLPFTPNITTGGGVYVSGQDFPSDAIAPTVAIGSGSAVLYFRYIRDNANFSTMSFTAGMAVHLSISYTTSA